MGGSDEENEKEKERKRDIVGDFLYASFIRQQHLDLLRDPSG
jgi:hypothetical protein